MSAAVVSARETGREGVVERLRVGIHPAAVWLIALVVLILRRPDAQLVYEDGYGFYLDARTDPLGTFLKIDGGYLHPLTRLIALVEVAVPAPYAPVVATLAAWMVVATVVTVAWRLWPPLALVVLLLPNTEMGLGSPTFLHFYLGIGLLLGVCFERVGVVGRLGLAAAALTGPTSLLVAPLYFARAAIVRDRDAVWRLVAVTVPATVHVLTVSGNRGLYGQDVSLIDAFSFGATHMTTMLIGRGAAGVMGPLVSPVLAAVLVGGIVALAVLAARRVPWQVSAGVGFVVLATVGSAILGSTENREQLLAPGSSARYFWVAGVALSGLILLAAYRGSRAGLFLVLVLVVGWGGDFFLEPRPPSSWATDSACFDTPGPCTVPVYPYGERWDIEWPTTRR